MYILKPGGRAGLVLPDGNLFGDGVTARIKEKLLDECNLHTIVRLPHKVFAPYTDIKTNLLFFTKGQATQKLWYYEHPLPEGYKAYSKTKPMLTQEFGPEIEWWNAREEKENAWCVSIDDIKARSYNLDIKNPNKVDEGPGDPDELLEQLASVLTDVSRSQEALKAQLADALERPIEQAAE